jgi:hypothetical protein
MPFLTFLRGAAADADKLRTKPFPLGAGHDKSGLGFQIASSDLEYANFRSAGQHC